MEMLNADIMKNPKPRPQVEIDWSKPILFFDSPNDWPFASNEITLRDDMYVLGTGGQLVPVATPQRAALTRHSMGGAYTCLGRTTDGKFFAGRHSRVMDQMNKKFPQGCFQP